MTAKGWLAVALSGAKQLIPAELQAYLDRSWDDFINPASPGLRNAVMRLGRIRLPNPVVAPNGGYFAGTQFYWDTYFTVMGLIAAGRLTEARGMVDNLVYLFPKFGLIPARNSWTSIGRTQPPFLTRMAFEVYESGGADMDWLLAVMDVAVREYDQVWHGAQRFLSELGLNRYRPSLFPGRLSVFESGWDLSTRYITKDIVPVDLNSLLYRYESDFAELAKMRGNLDEEAGWRARLERRRQAMERHLWSADSEFFMDKGSGFKTLAGFYTLWAGAATPQQAALAVGQLSEFRGKYALAASEVAASRGYQWDHPNGWAPLVMIVYQGLINYGYRDQALKVAEEWVALNVRVFERTGRLWEKYDVESGDIGRPGRYPTASGFAWTNAVLLWLLRELEKPAW